MKNSPVIPYILIMAFGIGLIFFMSLQGAGHNEEAGGETDSSGGDAVLVQQCISCHGGNLEGGGVGPQLVGLDPEHIVDVLVNGLPGSAIMVPGMKSEAEAEAIAEYISSLE